MSNSIAFNIGNGQIYWMQKPPAIVSIISLMVKVKG